MENGKKRLAVFYDAENISAYHVPRIFAFLQTLGVVAEQEAHGDYSLPIMAPWNDMVLKNVPVRLIHKPHNGKKEVADKSVMNEIASYPIDHPGTTIVVVSSDNDFAETASVLARRGIEVVGIGTRSQSRDAWINSCSSFYFIEDIACPVPDGGDEGPCVGVEEEIVPAREAETSRIGEFRRPNKSPRREKGVVSSLRLDMDCGFVESADGACSYYFSLSDIARTNGELPLLAEGMYVVYDVLYDYNPSGATRREKNGQCVNVKPDEAEGGRLRILEGKVTNVLAEKCMGFAETSLPDGVYVFRFSDFDSWDGGVKPPVSRGDRITFVATKIYCAQRQDPRDRMGSAKSCEVVGKVLEIAKKRFPWSKSRGEDGWR